MPNGPPWILSVQAERKDWPVTVVNPPYDYWYHITFDENKLWNVTYSLALDGTNNNEFNLAFYKPVMGFPPGKKDFAFIGQFNNTHPNENGSWMGTKFDNEDIYLYATYKVAPDPALTFADCTLNSLQWPTSQGSSIIITFNGSGQSTIDLQMALAN
jgi:hypothetical protein